ncbi:uncharacterized protein LOC114297541 [Camellia sinensis]|uniref:uncharacterized protein LOC114297541 n=1 Tax=Camellia sinensis TaxID=4442 RepID=UPI0010357FD9|nr:uncharacterized protein LOC114297541 [Camellia sinensis]
MKLQLQRIMQNIQNKPFSTANSLFTASNRDKPLPPKFKMPSIDTFDGTTDPVNHVEVYRTLRILHAFPDEIMCRSFLVTLKGSTRLCSSNIIFLNAFRQLKIGKEKLSLLQTPLAGFIGDGVTSIGSIDLPITIEEHLRQTTKILTFLVVDSPFAFNIILGRIALNVFQVVTSTYHLVVKFSTNHGIGTVRGEQTVATKCYVASLKELKLKEAMIIEGLDVRDEEELIRGELVEELVEGIFHPERNNLITEEMDKLLKAKFIQNVEYPKRLSNVVLVRKNNGKWRLCVDYSDLNWACPKDCYPLPRIDLLVDATAGH